MKFKKIMIVTFLLLAVLTVGAVSASEDITSQDLAVSENADEVSIDASVGDEVISGDGGDEIIASSENEVISDENPSEGSDDENPFGIYVNEDEIITNISDEGYNEDTTIAEMLLPSDTEKGRFNAFVNGEVLFNKDIEDGSSWYQDESGNLKCSVSLKDINLNYLSDDAEVEFSFWINGEKIEEYTKFMKVQVTDSTIRFYNDGSDDQWDGEDGVIINVFNGEDREFDLNSDLETPFALISVSNHIHGFIRIYIYDDEEDEWNIFFEKSLSEITNKKTDEENEGFTVYSISLNDFGDKLNDVLDERYFEIGFWSDDDNRIDNRAYNIEYDDSESNVKFWENDGDDEGIHGEGEEIIAEFTNANKLNNGVVVSIPKDNVPDDVDDEFTVIIPQEEDEPKEITFKLTEILDGDNYVIRVNDLQLPEFEESCEIQLILQFYREGEKAYYAQWWDDEFGIRIYQSPFIFDESSLLSDDDVITIQEIPEGVDEFTVTISKEGSEDIVKTFKFSEMDIDDEEPCVAFKLADLGITETGDYSITVKYSEDLTYSGNINVNKNVDIRGPSEDDDGNPMTLTSIDQRVVKFRISESVTGYVKVYVGGTQVGENLNLADLPMEKSPSGNGRKILLNNLNITESGEYTVKVKLYNDNDELLGEAEYNIAVEVGESSVIINGGLYPYGTESGDGIEYTIAKPLSDNQYYNIYFNGVKAGKITADGIELNDEFTVQMFDVKLYKPGNYNVNVTFFDGETETDVTTGSFSVNELTLTSDKEVYVYGKDSVIISFTTDSVSDEASLRAYYVHYWDAFEMDGNMIFNPYGGDQLKEDGLYNDGVISFDVAWFKEPDNDNYRLDMGKTLIYVTYEEDGEIYGGFIEINVIEEPEIVPVDPALKITPVSDVEEGSDVLIEVSANETFTGVVNVLIGENVVATVDVVEGYGNVTVAAGNFSVGVNTVKVNCSAGELFTEGFDEVTFSVNQKIIPPTPVDPALKISVANIIEGADAVIVITTNETFSGNVLVQIGTSNYTVPVVNGAGSLPVSGLAVGEHTVKAIFDATEGFTSGEANTVFSVTAKPVTPTTPTTPTTPKAPTKKADVIKLTLKTVKVKKSAKKLVLQATLKINGKYAKKGTNVKFRFNGKTYKAKIGKKGVAKLTIKKKVLKKLKAGKKVKYQVSYGKKTVKKTVKVKR